MLVKLCDTLCVEADQVLAVSAEQYVSYPERWTFVIRFSQQKPLEWPCCFEDRAAAHAELDRWRGILNEAKTSLNARL